MHVLCRDLRDSLIFQTRTRLRPMRRIITPVANAVAGMKLSVDKTSFPTTVQPNVRKRKRTTLADAPLDPNQGIKHRDLKDYLTVEEWRKLLAAAEASGPRNTALILVMYELGLRREEPGLINLNYCNKLHQQQLYVWRGKDSLSGYCDLSERTSRALYDWIKTIYTGKTLDAKLFVFPGLTPDKGLTGRAVFKIYFKLAVKAGLPANARHPHILKRSRCQHILEAAVEQGLAADSVYQTLAQIVGHRSAATTIRHYTARTSAEKRLVDSVTELMTRRSKED